MSRCNTRKLIIFLCFISLSPQPWDFYFPFLSLSIPLTSSLRSSLKHSAHTELHLTLTPQQIVNNEDFFEWNYDTLYFYPFTVTLRMWNMWNESLPVTYVVAALKARSITSLSLFSLFEWKALILKILLFNISQHNIFMIISYDRSLTGITMKTRITYLYNSQ